MSGTAIKTDGKICFSFLCVAAGVLTAAAGTLEWVGASGGTWDTTTQNWRDENGDPSAWVDGSTAVFGDDGGASITASGTINVGGLKFQGSTRPTISGGTLNFAAQMPIDVNTYKGATISSALTFANGFVAKFVQPECAHPGALILRGPGQWDQYHGGTNTLWRNCRLEDLEIKSMYYRTGLNGTAFLVQAYHPRWVNGRLNVQFQRPNGVLGGIIIAFVEFAQDGDDVTVWVDAIRELARDVNGNLLKLGDDIVALNAAGLIPSSGGTKPMADGINFQSGWSVHGSEIHAEPKGTLEFSGAYRHEYNDNSTKIGACVVSNGTWQITGSSGGQHRFDTGDTMTGNGSLLLKHTGASSTAYFDYYFTNALTGGLTIDGGRLTCHGSTFTGVQACGSGCPVRVINGGLVQFNTWAHNTLGGNSDTGATLYVGPNSKFTSSQSHRNLRWVRTIIDGGSLTADYNGSSGTVNLEVFDLTLRNGAQVTEDAFSIGSLRFGTAGKVTKTPRLTVDGTNEITVAGRIRIVIDKDYAKNQDYAEIPNNQYTTFDTQQNLRLTGGIMTALPSENAEAIGRRLRKCGAGKLIFDYSQDDYPANSQRENTIEICVDQGTLELRKSNAIVRTQALSLYGAGEVTSAANVSTDVAKLTIGGTNTIDFAAGSVLTCTNLTFTAAAKKLNLTGEVGDRSFRVGTTKCLTSAQLAQVRINGRSAVQDYDGYLVPAGLMVIIR